MTQPSPSMSERPLRRIRLALDNHASDLLIVLPADDPLNTGSRYVQLEVRRAESDQWSWLMWDDVYDKLADEWRTQFRRLDASERNVREPKP